MHRGALLIAALVSLVGCARYGLVTGSGSLAWGGRVGVLFEPTRIPDVGTGYYAPPHYVSRGLRYGTDELVSVIVHAGRELDRALPGAAFGVGNLSPRNGGSSRWHRSHQSGRDVDLFFLVTDAGGDRAQPEKMYRFRADGTANQPAGMDSLHFDDAANWLLVRALITSPIAEVQWIFISDGLKQRLLDHAVMAGEPAPIVERASYLLHQPSDSLPHDDHMHVRIFCPTSNLRRGCRDFGALRWVKRDYKYERRTDRSPAAEALAALLARPLRAAVAASALPVRGFVPL